jgi:hypothetical protein
MRQMQTLQQSQQGPSGSQNPAQYTPHTPQMSAVIDAASPAQLLGASPRNPNVTSMGGGLAMTRMQSKGGAMLPPQSPAQAMGRSTTPKPRTGLTPKSGGGTVNGNGSGKDESSVSGSQWNCMCQCG